MRLLVFKPEIPEISRYITEDCLDALVEIGQEVRTFDLSIYEDLKEELNTSID